MRRLAVAVCVSLMLAGCSANGSPQADLQARMNAITEAANAKDAAGLRSAVDDFLREVRQQSANNDITLRKAQDLQKVATRLAQNASALEQTEQSPSPEPSPTAAPPSAEPSPIIEISTSPAARVFSPAASPQS